MDSEQTLANHNRTHRIYFSSSRRFTLFQHTRSGEGNTFVCCYAYLLHKDAQLLGRMPAPRSQQQLLFGSQAFFY